MTTTATSPDIHDHEHDHHGHDHGDHDHGHHIGEQEERKIDLQILAVLVGGIVLLAAVICWIVFETSEQYAILAAIASVLLGGPIVYGAAKSMITGKCSHDHGPGEHHHHEAGGSHMEELVAIAVLASFAQGAAGKPDAFLECAAVAFFMLIASYIEHRTAAGALRSIEDLIRITPTRALKLTENGEEEVPAAQLKSGDRVIIRPGDNIPADGIIRKGSSTINQANITGESVPVEKTLEDEVFSGTINETGVLEVEVTRAGADSTLGKVQDLILQAAASRPAVMRMLNKYAGYYTPAVLMIAGIVYFFSQNLDHAISLLLIACPCAIILAAPTAMVAGLSAASRLGVYVKNVSDLEVSRRISAIVLDKTGTLTVGQLSVTRLFPVEGVTGPELLAAAAAVEHNSKHPVAKAVVKMSQKARVQLAEATNFEEVAGRGVKGLVDGRQIFVGREAWIAEQGVDISSLDTTSAEGMSVLFVARDGQPMGWIGLEDQVRKGAAVSMDELEALGVKRRVMITGDRWSPARKVAAAIHVTDIEAEALPGDKLELVKDLRKAGHTVAVVGDGVNDGPALAAGDVSIAMGAAGSDVALNSASVALMNNELNRIPFLVTLSRRTVSVIRQNLIGTMIYIFIMLLFLAAGWMSPLVAAIGHGVSSIVVVFNSARLIREGENLVDHLGPEETAEHRRRHRQIESVKRDAASGTGQAMPAAGS